MTTNSLNLSNLRLAVLIDAENVPRNCIKRVMEEIAIYGTPTIKRIYGDWTSPVVSGWKSSLLENAITPIQQYSYTQGKNSSDSAMIIDAMDILYTERTDGFVIVSSDSDFTRLAIRLREAGQRVIGIGERKTPRAFIAACDKFTYIEVINKRYADTMLAEGGALNEAEGKAEADDKTEQDVQLSSPQKKHDRPKTQTPVPDDVVEIIADSVADLAGDSGSVFLGELGNLILKKQPDFDYRNFGHKSLTSMIKSIDRFETEFRQTADPNIKHVFVRDKES
ncbi:MAG: NYN domain-containing protein [Oscillospiraceae bacterium]|nr:NYN domain-containing protein [Oscillospiraceae bacterium]